MRERIIAYKNPELKALKRKHEEKVFFSPQKHLHQVVPETYPSWDMPNQGGSDFEV